jgi:hypothetical protein
MINGTRQLGDYEYQKFREDATGKPAVAILDMGNLSPMVNYDYIDIQQTNSTTETYVFKTGGSGGSTVRTIVVVYTSSAKTDLDSVTYS